MLIARGQNFGAGEASATVATCVGLGAVIGRRWATLVPVAIYVPLLAYGALNASADDHGDMPFGAAAVLLAGMTIVLIVLIAIGVAARQASAQADR